MSQALRKLTGSITKTKSMVIFINQIRMKIGVVYGSPEVTTGGNALKFYSSVRIDIRRKGNIKKGDEILGAETRVKVVKNKVAPPFKEATFDILYGEGISREGELLDLGSEFNIVDKSGAWYSYEGTRIGQGKDNAREYLKQHEDAALEIENRIRALKGMKNRPTSLTPGEPAPEPVKDEEAVEAKKPARSARGARAAEPDMIDESVIEPDELFE